MLRLLRGMPFFKVLAIAQTALLAWRHLQGLDPAERRRLAELARRGHRMNRAERDELRRLVSKLEPRAFASAAAGTFAPGRVPRWMAKRSPR